MPPPPPPTQVTQSGHPNLRLHQDSNVPIPLIEDQFYGLPPSEEPPELDNNQVRTIQKQPLKLSSNYASVDTIESIDEDESFEKEQNRTQSESKPEYISFDQVKKANKNAFQRTNHSTNIYHGYLWKQGEINTNYKKRYFRLYSNCEMQYFENASTAIKGSIDLKSDVSLKKTSDYDFEIITSKRTYYLRISKEDTNSETADSWLTQICKVCQIKKSSIQIEYPEQQNEGIDWSAIFSCCANGNKD